MNITKKLTMLTYSGPVLTLSSNNIKTNINTIFSINSAGNGYISFSSSSLFNSLNTLTTNETYLIDSKIEQLPWDLPDNGVGENTSTTSTTAPATTAAPTTTSPTTAAPTTASPTTAAPTTASPTTAAPTTVAPTTAEPTTASPTTTLAPVLPYALYATQSNSTPSTVTANVSGVGSAGNTGNFANYNGVASWNGAIGNLTTVGTNGNNSYFGTYDQSGNIWEWNDAIVQDIYRVIRGGAYNTTSANVLDLSSTNRRFSSPNSSVINYGFRICCKYPVPITNTLIEFVPILASENAVDYNGYGSVTYDYCISRYPITNTQYAQFLSSIASSDTYGVYALTMATNIRGGINSDYTIKTNMGNKPVNYITWFRAARFANWLHNGMPSGLQSPETTEAGTYLLNGANSGISFVRNPEANYWIPSEDEWYKAAFYKPNVT